MPKIRWFMFFLGIAVLLLAILRGDIKNILIAFLVGLIYGLFIDFIGARLIPLWKYAGSKLGYIMITIPCWGAFSMAVNLPWDWIQNSWLAFPIVAIGIFSYLELPNLKTKSSWTIAATRLSKSFSARKERIKALDIQFELLLLY